MARSSDAIVILLIGTSFPSGQPSTFAVSLNQFIPASSDRSRSHADGEFHSLVGQAREQELAATNRTIEQPSILGLDKFASAQFGIA